MKRFKYKVEKKYCDFDYDFYRNTPKELEYLTNNGNEGWELVSVVPYGPTSTIDYTLYYWKKEI